MDESVRNKHQTLRDYKQLLKLGADSDSALENSTQNDRVLDVSVPTENDDRFTSISQRPVNPLSFEHTSSNTLPLPTANMVAHVGFWQDQNMEEVAFLDTSSNSNYFAEKTDKNRFPINLKDWKPKLQDEQLVIEGVLDEEKRLSAHFVKRRLFSYIFCDQHETVCSLLGEISPNTSLPAVIKEHFLNGIPENWLLVCEYWKSLSRDTYSEIPPVIPIYVRKSEIALNQSSISTPQTVSRKRRDSNLSRINKSDRKLISKRHNKYSANELQRKVEKYTNLLNLISNSNINDNSTSSSTIQNVGNIDTEKFGKIKVAQEKVHATKKPLGKSQRFTILPKNTQSTTNLSSNRSQLNIVLRLQQDTNALPESPQRVSSNNSQLHIGPNCLSKPPILSSNVDTSSKQSFKSLKQKQSVLKSLMPRLEESDLINKQLPATKLDQNGISSENDSEININDFIREPKHKISFISNSTFTENTLNKVSRNNSKRADLFSDISKKYDFFPTRKSCEITSFHASNLSSDLTLTSDFKKHGQNSSITKRNKDLISNDSLINIVKNNSKSEPTKIQKSTNNINISNESTKSKIKSIRDQNSNVPNNSKIESAIAQVTPTKLPNLRSLDIDSDSEDSEIINNNKLDYVKKSEETTKNKTITRLQSKSRVLVSESDSEDSNDSISNIVIRKHVNKSENTNKINPQLATKLPIASNEKSQINHSSIHSDSESDDIQISNNKTKSKNANNTAVNKIVLKSPTIPLNKRSGKIIKPRIIGSDSDSIELNISNNVEQSIKTCKGSFKKEIESKMRKNRKNVVEKNNHILHEKPAVYVEDKRRSSIIKNITSEMDVLKLNSTELNLSMSRRGRVRCQTLPFWTGKRLTNYSVSNSTVIDSTDNGTMGSKRTVLNKSKNRLQNTNSSIVNTEMEHLQRKRLNITVPELKSPQLLVVLNNIRSNILTQQVSPEKLSNTKIENKLSDSKKAQMKKVLKDIKTKCQRPSVNPAKKLIDSEIDYSDISRPESPINSKRIKLRNSLTLSEKMKRINISSVVKFPTNLKNDADNLTENSVISTTKWSKVSFNSNNSNEQSQASSQSFIQSNEKETNIKLVTHNSRIDQNKASIKNGNISPFLSSSNLELTKNSQMEELNLEIFESPTKIAISQISTNSSSRCLGASNSKNNRSKMTVITEEEIHNPVIADPKNSSRNSNTSITRSNGAKNKVIAEEEINNETLRGSDIFLNSEYIQNSNTSIYRSNSNSSTTPTIIDAPTNTPRTRSTSNSNNSSKTSDIVDPSTTFQSASKCANTSRGRSSSKSRRKTYNTVTAENPTTLQTAPNCAISQIPNTRNRSSLTSTKRIINIDTSKNLQIDSNIDNDHTSMASMPNRSKSNQRRRSPEYANPQISNTRSLSCLALCRTSASAKCSIPQIPNTRSRSRLTSTKCIINTDNSKGRQIDSNIENDHTRVASRRSRNKSNQRSRSPACQVDNSTFKIPINPVKLRNSCNNETKSTELRTNSIRDETTKDKAKASKSIISNISTILKLSASTGEYYENSFNMIPIVSIPRLNLENDDINSAKQNAKTDVVNVNQMNDKSKSIHTLYKRSKSKSIVMENIKQRKLENVNLKQSTEIEHNHSHNLTKSYSDISSTSNLSLNTTISQRGRSRVPTLQYWTGARLSTIGNQTTIETPISNNQSILNNLNFTKTPKPIPVNKNVLRTNSSSKLTTLNSIDPKTSNNITDCQMPVLNNCSKKSLQLEQNNSRTAQKNNASCSRVLQNMSSKADSSSDMNIDSDNGSDWEMPRSGTRTQNEKGKTKKALKNNNSIKKEKVVNVQKSRKEKEKNITLPNNAPELMQRIKYNTKAYTESMSQASQTSSSARRRKLFPKDSNDIFDQLNLNIKESQNFVLRIPDTFVGSDDGMSEISSIAYKKIKLF